jgi:hypothetical protein
VARKKKFQSGSMSPLYDYNPALSGKIPKLELASPKQVHKAGEQVSTDLQALKPTDRQRDSIGNWFIDPRAFTTAYSKHKAGEDLTADEKIDLGIETGFAGLAAVPVAGALAQKGKPMIKGLAKQAAKFLGSKVKKTNAEKIAAANKKARINARKNKAERLRKQKLKEERIAAEKAFNKKQKEAKAKRKEKKKAQKPDKPPKKKSIVQSIVDKVPGSIVRSISGSAPKSGKKYRRDNPNIGIKGNRPATKTAEKQSIQQKPGQGGKIETGGKGGTARTSEKTDDAIVRRTPAGRPGGGQRKTVTGKGGRFSKTAAAAEKRVKARERRRLAKIGAGVAATGGIAEGTRRLLEDKDSGTVSAKKPSTSTSTSTSTSKSPSTEDLWQMVQDSKKKKGAGTRPVTKSPPKPAKKAKKWKSADPLYDKPRSKNMIPGDYKESGDYLDAFEENIGAKKGGSLKKGKLSKNLKRKNGFSGRGAGAALKGF